MHLRRSTAVAIALLLAAVAPARAAADVHDHATTLATSWDAAYAVGDLRSTYGKTSLLGLRVDARAPVSGPIAVGVTGSWNRFALGGSANPTLNAFTVLGTVHWYGSRGALQPFVGLGAGASRRLWAGASGDYGLAVEPQLGVLIPIEDSYGVQLTLHYDVHPTRFAHTESGGTIVRSVPQWIGLAIGIATD